MSSQSSDSGGLSLLVGGLLCLTFLGGAALLLGREETLAALIFLLAGLLVAALMVWGRGDEVEGHADGSRTVGETPVKATSLFSESMPQRRAPVKEIEVASPARRRALRATFADPGAREDPRNVGVLADDAAAKDSPAEASQAEDPGNEAPAAKPVTAVAQAAVAMPSDGAPDDDLKKIEGIGPKIDGLLKADGIRTFAHLATAQVTRLQGILDAAGPRYKLAVPETWPEQAELAAAGRWQDLKSLQKRLKGGRRAG